MIKKARDIETTIIGKNRHFSSEWTGNSRKVLFASCFDRAPQYAKLVMVVLTWQKLDGPHGLQGQILSGVSEVK